LLLCLLPAFLLTAAAIPCVAQEAPLPAELSFISKVGKPHRITYESWAEMQMPKGNYGSGGLGKMVRGKHWEFPVIVSGDMTENAVWAIIKPAFLANGWTAVHEWSAGGILLFLDYQKDGVEAWAQTDPCGAAQAGGDIIESAPMPFTFTFKQPAATPEAVNTTAGDFPWLGSQPGSRFRSGDYEVHSVMGHGF
jgi:hypothetical protein